MPSWRGFISRLTGRNKASSKAERDSRASQETSRSGTQKRDPVIPDERRSTEKRGLEANASQNARSKTPDRDKPPSYESVRLADQTKGAAAYVQSMLDSRPEGMDPMEQLNRLASSRNLQVRIAVADEMARLTIEANNARNEERNRSAYAQPVDTPTHSSSSREPSSPVPQSLEQAGQFAEAAWKKLPPRFDTSNGKSEPLSLQEAMVSRNEDIKNAAREVASEQQIKYYTQLGVKIAAEENSRLAKPAEHGVGNSAHGMETAGHGLQTPSRPGLGQETARVFKERPRTGRAG